MKISDLEICEACGGVFSLKVMQEVITKDLSHGFQAPTLHETGHQFFCPVHRKPYDEVHEPGSFRRRYYKRQPELVELTPEELLAHAIKEHDAV